MSQCYQSGDFMDYFHENMSALGVPAPKSLFTTYTTVIAETSLITGAIGTSARRQRSPNWSALPC